MQDTVENLFIQVDDPRVQGRYLHRLKDILFISFCTLLSNGEGFEDMAEFAEQRLEWLSGILELPNGIPSHNTFNHFLQMIDPDKLSISLEVDAEVLIESVKSKLISLDGKKMRGVSP